MTPSAAQHRNRDTRHHCPAIAEGRPTRLGDDSVPVTGGVDAAAVVPRQLARMLETSPGRRSCRRRYIVRRPARRRSHPLSSTIGPRCVFWRAEAVAVVGTVPRSSTIACAACFRHLTEDRTQSSAAVTPHSRHEPRHSPSAPCRNTILTRAVATAAAVPRPCRPPGSEASGSGRIEVGRRLGNLLPTRPASAHAGETH